LDVPTESLDAVKRAIDADRYEWAADFTRAAPWVDGT